MNSWSFVTEFDNTHATTLTQGSRGHNSVKHGSVGMKNVSCIFTLQKGDTCQV